MSPDIAPALTLVVPMYNESARFRDSADQLADFVAAYPGGRLVFVDDGSTDATAAHVQRFIAERPGACIELVRCPHRGKGAAIEAGLVTVRSGVAAFCDVDLSTPLRELAVVIAAAMRAEVLAIGSRGTATSRLVRRQGRARELAGRAYNRAVQLSVVPGITDTQCGAKAATAEVWHAVLGHTREEGFAWDVEVIALARTLAIPVQEVGIEWRHHEGSQVRPVRDGIRMLRAIPRIRTNVHSIRPPVVADDPVGSDAGAAPGVFGEANARRLASADAAHWWFRSKATFVSLLIRRFSPGSGLLVDVGAGSGGVTAMLGWAPDHALALDGNVELVSATQHRHALLSAVCDGAAVPVRRGVASVVCALDVIEHVSDPGPIVREAARIVRPDGIVIVNVPAHPWLWSEADEVLGHVRRYTRRSLRRDLERNGLEVVWISHVFSWLALPVWLRRRGRVSSDEKLGLDVSAPWISYTAMFLTRVEGFVARWISLPIGSSVLCVARVPGADAAAGRRNAATSDELFELQETLYESRNPTRRHLHRTRRDWIIDALGRYGPGSNRVLEIGPGSGVYLPTLASVAREVVASDIEHAYLDHLTEFTTTHDVRLVWDDITSSEFADGAFDLVLCSEVIEHIRDGAAALREMRRILRPDGTLVLSTPQRFSFLEVAAAVAFWPGMIQVARRVYREPVIPTGHINLMTQSQLQEQLRASGFEVVETWVAGVYLPIVAELLGERAVRIEQACERRLRGTRAEGVLWTQFVVARPTRLTIAASPQP